MSLIILPVAHVSKDIKRNHKSLISINSSDCGIVGSRITIDGKEGVVRSIGSGRVQVDFNPYLAGKSLECWVRIVNIIEDKIEKIRSLIHTNIPDVDINKFEIIQDGEEVRITIPREAFLFPDLQISKRILAKDIIDHIEGVEKIVFLENYDRQMF